MQLDSERWGVQITRVEIFNILPPADIADAMEQQIRAERSRRAQVLRADGQREAAVIMSRGTAAETLNEAEGERASAITRAKGAADAKVLEARAQAASIRHLRGALTEGGFKAVDYLSSISYLNTLGRISAGGEAVLLPWEAVSAADSIMSPSGPRPVAA